MYFEITFQSFILLNLLLTYKFAINPPPIPNPPTSLMMMMMGKFIEIKKNVLC